MGWLQLARRRATQQPRDFRIQVENIKPQSEHVENLEQIVTVCQEPQELKNTSNQSQLKYPFRPLDTPDDDLPLIPREEVLSKRRPGLIAPKASDVSQLRSEYWIVVDSIVYDCTEFIEEHPGGEQVILSFLGEDCSWQFWRFHGKDQMEQYGRALRIGRTEGVENRFTEPKRFVGLTKWNDDDW